MFSLERGEYLQFGGLGHVVETREEYARSLCIHAHGVDEVTQTFTQGRQSRRVVGACYQKLEPSGMRGFAAKIAILITQAILSVGERE